MKATLFTRTFIACPSCDDRDNRWSYDHITVGGTFGPWFCDQCGHAFRGVVNADGSVEVEVVAERRIETMDLVVLEPQPKPVYFIVPGARYEGGLWNRNDDGDEDDRKRYSYEEHSCPTNWLKPEAMRYERDNDPHGLITYLGHVDASALPPEQQPHCGRQAWEYFPAFRPLLEARGEQLDDDDS